MTGNRFVRLPVYKDSYAANFTDLAGMWCEV